MKIGIVGLGLIGGSLGFDFRALGHYVLGISRRPSTCEVAQAKGAVDQASSDLSLLATADVIFICTPLEAIEATVKQLIPHIRDTTMLTDVGSVKASVVQKISPLWPRFIGGHPMAGKEATGIEVAQANLFAQKPYVLTPTANTSERVTATITALVADLDADVHQCDPAAHDRAVAWISHLPKMASAGLIAACLSEPEPALLALAQTFASSGFRDTSRVGGGNPELGWMMAKYNRQEVLRTLSAYRQAMDEVTTLIEESDWDALEALFVQTQQARAKFL